MKNILIFLCLLLGGWITTANAIETQWHLPPLSEGMLPYSEEREMTIKEKIVVEARAHGIDEQEALDIAFCESSFNPKAKHNLSTAKGLYMFIDATWKNYCSGDVMNEDDNIACFMDLYDKHPTWWECYYLIS